MHYLPAFVIACVLLVYAALSVDAQRKCDKGQKPTQSESSILKYVNVTMLIIGIVTVLYFGWHLFVPDDYKAKTSNYF